VPAAEGLFCPCPLFHSISSPPSHFPFLSLFLLPLSQLTLAYAPCGDASLREPALYPCHGVFIPHLSFFTIHPLPDDWIVVLPQHKAMQTRPMKFFSKDALLQAIQDRSLEDDGTGADGNPFFTDDDQPLPVFRSHYERLEAKKAQRGRRKAGGGGGTASLVPVEEEEALPSQLPTPLPEVGEEEGDAAAEEGEGEQKAPEGDAAVEEGEGEKKAPEGDAAVQEGEGEKRAPEGDEAPKEGEDVAKEREAPKIDDEAPKVDEAPTENGEVPNEGGDGEEEKKTKEGAEGTDSAASLPPVV
jgi:hypothetical protein